MGGMLSGASGLHTPYTQADDRRGGSLHANTGETMCRPTPTYISPTGVSDLCTALITQC